MSDLAFDRMIDITADLCPMTFVRTRLALDRMASGEVLLVRLTGAEPRENVPRTAEAQGHAVLHCETGMDDVTQLWLRRK
jgi:TusA-related sulfurtransferase